MFIKKIFEDKIDRLVHLQFQKFSKGNFKNRALIKASNSKGNYKIATGYEYANDFVRMVAEKLGNNKTKITGGIITTFDLTGKLDFKDKKQFMGVKQYVLDTDMTGKEILDLLDKFPFAFMALSFKTNDTELKIKPKAPKSAKPSTKGDARPNPNFCKMNTTDKNLIKNILFDIDLDDFKKVEGSHEFVINDLILPKGEKDSSKIRELTQRKGIVLRKINVDEKETISKKNFVA